MKIENKNIYFERIFDYLVTNGIIVRKHKHKLKEGEYNKLTFAKKLGTHSGVIPAILSGERNVTEPIIRNLIKHFDVREAYIRMGEIPMFKRDFDGETTPNNGGGNILYSAAYATAGDHISDDVLERDDVHFAIPGLHGSLVAFDVKGNSMDPILNSGDMVFCRPIDGVKSLNREDVYAVYAEGQVRIKYIELVNRKGITQLKLTSHNSIEHQPIYVNADHTTKIFKVVNFLTNMGGRLNSMQ